MTPLSCYTSHLAGREVKWFSEHGAAERKTDEHKHFFTPFIGKSIPVLFRKQIMGVTRLLWTRNINDAALLSLTLRNREDPTSLPLVDHLPVKLLPPERSLLCFRAAELFSPPADVMFFPPHCSLHRPAHTPSNCSLPTRHHTVIYMFKPAISHSHVSSHPH